MAGTVGTCVPQPLPLRQERGSRGSAEVMAPGAGAQQRLRQGCEGVAGAVTALALRAQLPRESYLISHR